MKGRSRTTEKQKWMKYRENPFENVYKSIKKKYTQPPCSKAFHLVAVRIVLSFGSLFSLLFDCVSLADFLSQIREQIRRKIWQKERTCVAEQFHLDPVVLYDPFPHFFGFHSRILSISSW